jgi:hypothetical protein
VGSIRAALTLLDGSFAADGDLGAGVRLHLLQCVTAGSDK